MSLQELEKEIETRKETSSKQITEATRKECIEILASSVSTLSEELQRINEKEKRKLARSLVRGLAGVSIENDNYKYKWEFKSIAYIKAKEKLIKWKKRIDLKKQREFAWKYWLQFNQEDNTLNYKWKTRSYTDSSRVIKDWKNQIDESLKKEKEKKQKERNRKIEKEREERNKKIQKEKTIKKVKVIAQRVLIASLITVWWYEYHEHQKMNYYKKNISNIWCIDKKNNKYISKLKNYLDFSGIKNIDILTAYYIRKFQAKTIKFANVEISDDSLSLISEYKGEITFDKLSIKNFENKYPKDLERFLAKYKIKELDFFWDITNKSLIRMLLKNFNGEILNLSWYNIDTDLIEIVKKASYNLELGYIKDLTIEKFNILSSTKNISFNEKKTAKMISDNISYEKNLTLDEFIFTLKHGTYISNTQIWQIKMIDINTPYIKKEFISYIDKYKIGWINFRNSNTTNLSIYYALQSNIKYLNISGKHVDKNIIKYISMSNLECIKIFEAKDWSTSLQLLDKSNIKYIDLREANLHWVHTDYLVEYGDRFILPEYTTNYIKKIRQENNRNKYYNKYKAPEDKIRTTFSGGHTTIHLETNIKASIAEKYPLCEYDNQGLPETSPCYTRGKGTYIVRERK